MPNQNSPLNGQGQAVELMVDKTNVAFQYAAGDEVATAVALGAEDPSAAQMVQLIKAASAPFARVASSATSVTLLVANTSTVASTSRKGVSIYNESTAILYVRLAAAAASVTEYWRQIAANSYADIPVNYTGEIRGIWASANGAAMVTEFI